MAGRKRIGQERNRAGGGGAPLETAAGKAPSALTAGANISSRLCGSEQSSPATSSACPPPELSGWLVGSESQLKEPENDARPPEAKTTNIANIIPNVVLK
jgi:hypothetical protein